ncbi:MAG: hypothetical protein KatS3mg057_0829 [Herpetosiphonaceae bacterium]|nr:MAG: hypothetical protein KatS3mg057_0829 [Herpetosiphonaceae bacterium]
MTTVLFFILSVALLLLALLLLWFIPHLLQQQEERSAQEARRLRELLSDMLGEQEAVALRQAQLGTSLSYLQDQIEQLTTSWPATVDDLLALPDERKSQQMLEELSQRILGLQSQLDAWMHHRSARQQSSQRENESWANLMSLLGAMQERLGQIERARQRPIMLAGTTGPGQAAVAGRAASPIDDVELEVRLRSIADDLVALRWRLQRSLQTPLNHLPGNGKGHHQHAPDSNGNGNGQQAEARGATIRPY